MKIKYALLLSFMFSNALYAADAPSQPIKINQTYFEFKTIQSDDDSTKELLLYQNNEKILSHTLYSNTGDCSSTQIELGTYAIHHNQITFYTYWAAADRQGLLIYPFGVRKQTYIVNALGKLKQSSAVIYIEDNISAAQADDSHLQDLSFLYHPPENLKQRQALKNYVKTIESFYKARFVTGKEKQHLFNEVKAKLAQPIQFETEGWEEEFGSNAKM
ncbi:MAG: hypothetical protein RR569_02770 [Acinetobacter sp.]